MIPSQNVGSKTDVTIQTDPDEPEFDGDYIQLNVDQQSYGEQPITNVSDNVATNCEEESQRHEKSYKKRKA